MSLHDHTLASDEEHARLSFRPGCPRCAARVVGPTPAVYLVSPATKASVMAFAVGASLTVPGAGVAAAQAPPAASPTDPAPPSEAAPTAPAEPVDESDDPARNEVPDLDRFIRNVDVDDSGSVDAEEGDEAAPEVPAPVAEPAPPAAPTPADPPTPPSTPRNSAPLESNAEQVPVESPAIVPTPTPDAAPPASDVTAPSGQTPAEPVESQDRDRKAKSTRPKPTSGRPGPAPTPAPVPTVPTSSVVQPTVAPPTPATNTASTATSVSTSNPVVVDDALRPIRGDTYTTVAGDNLETIAVRMYLPHRPAYAKVVSLRDKLYRMNEAVIGDDPNVLMIGVKLRLR